MKGFVSIRSFDYKKRRRQTVGGLVSEASTPVDIWHLPPPADDFGSAVTVVSLKADKDSKKNQICVKLWCFSENGLDLLLQ